MTSSVDLDEVEALRRLIAQSLAHDAAVTRADDEDILGIRVDGHGDVRDHLMIDELVLLRQHHIAVKRQEAAEFRDSNTSIRWNSLCAV